MEKLEENAMKSIVGGDDSGPDGNTVIIWWPNISGAGR
jgi:hypothetical protein